jgi:hypothetical protein
VSEEDFLCCGELDPSDTRMLTFLIDSGLICKSKFWGVQKSPSFGKDLNGREEIFRTSERTRTDSFWYICYVKREGAHWFGLA